MILHPCVLKTLTKAAFRSWHPGKRTASRSKEVFGRFLAQWIFEEIKPWAFGVGEPIPRPWTTRELTLSSVQSLGRVGLFVTPWIAALQAYLSITNSRSLLKLMPIELVMPSSHLILCHPFLLLPPNPSQHQHLFQWVNSLHEVAKVLEFQLQHQSFQWTPRTYRLQDGLVGSPCSPRDSQESSPTPQFKSINFLVLSFLHSPILTFIQDHWKNHSLDQTDVCWQNNVSAF